MILLVGNNKDDLLYFETRINNKKEEIVFNKYRVVIGNISSQGVVLITDVYTNILSSALIGYLVEKYYILFVIKVGKCVTLSPSLHTGDVVISKRIIASDVDVCDLQGTELGQIPNFASSYEISNDLITMISNSFAKVSRVNISPVTYISSNTHYTETKQLEPFIHDDKIFTVDIESSVFDSESYGIALICQLYDIQFVSVNVVLNRVGDKFTTSNYIKVLKQYVNVGKSLVNAISEIGSNEVMRD